MPEEYDETAAGIIPADWSNTPLSAISEAISETAGYRNFETLSISAGIGFVNQAEKFGKELSGKQYAKYTVLRRGDFAYNKGNSKRYPQGCTYMLKEREDAVVPNVFECFRIICGQPEYYEQLFIHGFMNKQLTRKINHGVRDDGLLNLTEEDFYSTDLPVPPFTEQQKIAEILATCDRMIELKQSKIDELNKLKQVCLLEMFPQKGQTIPKRRFPGFSAPWEQRKLGELIREISTGKSVNSDEGIVGADNIGVLKTSCVSYDHFDPSESKPVVKDERHLVKCAVEEDSVIVSRMNTPERVGACGYVERSFPNLFLPDRLWKLKFQENVNTYFLYTMLISGGYKEKITSMASGTSGSMYNIPKDAFLNLRLTLSLDIDEQKKIGDYFKQLDRLITLHQRELAEAGKYKKALMQLLLTGLVRVNA